MTDHKAIQDAALAPENEVPLSKGEQIFFGCFWTALAICGLFSLQMLAAWACTKWPHEMGVISDCVKFVLMGLAFSLVLCVVVCAAIFAYAYFQRKD